jgi:3-oxoadipate enol-lactonase
MKLRTNGIRIRYSIQGEGPWVVMSHSLACHSGMWDEQAGLLARRYKVLRFDTRGHGGSDAPAGAYTLDMLADDVRGVLNELGIDRCHWVGLSMGGMIGQVFALKYPGVFLTLTLADTTSRYGADARPVWDARIKVAREQGMATLVEPTLERWFTEPYRKAHPDTLARVAAMIRETPVDGYIGCCHAIPGINVTERLKDVRVPALVVVGEQDAATPLAAARDIERNLPDARLVVLPAAAHLSNIEQAAAFNEALSSFLAQHS